MNTVINDGANEEMEIKESKKQKDWTVYVIAIFIGFLSLLIIYAVVDGLMIPRDACLKTLNDVCFSPETYCRK